VAIFAAQATRPLCLVPASQADPLSVGARARALFAEAEPLLCAEAVLQAVSEALGCASPLIPRLATGFCSGLSRTCGPCGALSGGVMALGLALGRDSGRESLDLTYAPVQEFLEYFRSTFPSDNCQGLTGCDFATPQGQLAFRLRGVKQAVCLPVVAAAAAQIVRILAEHQAG
jgi:C_GCAxxG_C_C family probable redox protein